jgi:NodT family efflux transporter outer membrane factor (OMF) lipoprotein
MMKNKQVWKFYLYIILSVYLVGCAIGPNFHRPDAPKIKHYTEHRDLRTTAATATLGGRQQHIRLQQKIAANWWTVFHSKALNQLIQDALQANPDMRAAAMSLQMAHEATRVSRAPLLPLLSGNYFPTRQQTAGTLASNLSSNAYLYTLVTESLTISYVPDVFGGTRRQLESMKALEEMNRYQYEAVYITLTSNVVFNAIQEASLREQIATNKEIITTLQQVSKTLEQQKRFGNVGIETLALQRVLLEQSEALLPELELRLAQNRHALASLLGRYSSEDLSTQFRLQDFVLPQDLPLSLPSELIDNRPDIRAAEARMHAASAKIGVAMANRLPNITLSSNGGYMPITQSLNSIPSFLDPLPLGPTMFWGLGANLAGTIFDAGSLYFQKRAAVAAYDQAVAQYKRVVLDAFQSVADSLKAIEMDAIALQHTKKQVDASRVGFEMMMRRHELGSVAYLDVLYAKKIYEDAMLSLAQSQAIRFADTVALFQALGGGWSLEISNKSQKEST